MSHVVSKKSDGPCCLSPDYALYPIASMLQQKIFEEERIRREARLQDKKRVEKKKKDVKEQIIMIRKKTESYLNQIKKEFRNTIRYSNSRLAICSEFRFSTNNTILVTRYRLGYHSTRQDSIYRVGRQYIYLPYQESRKDVAVQTTERERHKDEGYKNQFKNTLNDDKISTEASMCDLEQQHEGDNKSNNALHDRSLYVIPFMSDTKQHKNDNNSCSTLHDLTISTDLSMTKQHYEGDGNSQNKSHDHTLSIIPFMCDIERHDDSENDYKSNNVSRDFKILTEPSMTQQHDGGEGLFQNASHDDTVSTILLLSDTEQNDETDNKSNNASGYRTLSTEPSMMEQYDDGVYLTQNASHEHILSTIPFILKTKQHHRNDKKSYNTSHKNTLSTESSMPEQHYEDYELSQNASHEHIVYIIPFMCDTEQQDDGKNDNESNTASHDPTLSTESSMMKQHNEGEDLSQNASLEHILCTIPFMCDREQENDGDNGNEFNDTSYNPTISTEPSMCDTEEHNENDNKSHNASHDSTLSIELSMTGKHDEGDDLSQNTPHEDTLVTIPFMCDKEQHDEYDNESNNDPTFSTKLSITEQHHEENNLSQNASHDHALSAVLFMCETEQHDDGENDNKSKNALHNLMLSTELSMKEQHHEGDDLSQNASRNHILFKIPIMCDADQHHEKDDKYNSVLQDPTLSTEQLMTKDHIEGGDLSKNISHEHTLSTVTFVCNKEQHDDCKNDTKSHNISLDSKLSIELSMTGQHDEGGDLSQSASHEHTLFSIPFYDTEQHDKNDNKSINASNDNTLSKESSIKEHYDDGNYLSQNTSHEHTLSILNLICDTEYNENDKPNNVSQAPMLSTEPSMTEKHDKGDDLSQNASHEDTLYTISVICETEKPHENDYKSKNASQAFMLSIEPYMTEKHNEGDDISQSVSTEVTSTLPFMCNIEQHYDTENNKSNNASHDPSLSTELSMTERHDESDDLSQNASTDDTFYSMPCMCDTKQNDDGDNGNKSQNGSDPHKLSTSLERESELHTEVKLLKEQNYRLSIHIQILEKKLREASTRMENMMGTGSVNDSDTDNALIKVTADGFSDIYNNSWMNAFEELADMNIDDMIIITLLLQLLKAADHHKATVHEEDNGSGEKIQELEHVEKKNFEKREIKLIGKYVDITPGAPFPTDVYTNTLKYGDACLEWCLTKTRCLPSVYLDFDVESGSEFNESFYRTYNKTGPVFDYVVWPAMFENRHGRLLTKGVAQPK